MKLLLCSLFQPDFIDGASVSARALAYHLRDMGVDVTVCTTDLGWRKEQILEAPRTEFVGLRVYHAWFSHPLEIAPQLAWFFYRHLRSYDLAHFRGIFSVGTCLGTLVARMLGCPYVISPLGNWPPKWSERGSVTKGTSKVLFFQMFCRQALAGASGIICASDAERDSVQQLLPSANVISISNGVDPIDTPLPSRHELCDRLNVAYDTELFLFLGRVSPEKGIDFLIRAWNVTSLKLPGARLVLAGDASLNTAHEQVLRSGITALTRPESLITPGAVTGAFKHALLTHSCCLLFPSYRESFGNVVLESLAAGTPVIASVGTPWSFLETNHLGKWLPWDETSWSDAMVSFAQRSATVRDEFSNRSRQWVRTNYSWQASAARYIQTYEGILGSFSNHRGETRLF